MVASSGLTLGKLRPASYNPRRIDEKAAEGLRYSLEEFGDISGITFNKRTGRLVCGHQRVDQLRTLGAQVVGGRLKIAGGASWPIRVVDWDESKEKAANLAANNPHIAGEWTPDLRKLALEVEGSIGPEMFANLSLDKLLLDSPVLKIESSEDEVPEPPKVAITKTGDVWLLGTHRLVCGAIEECAATVFDEPWSLLITDPPYGVSYAEKNAFLNAVGRGNLIQTPIENDHKTPEDMSLLWGSTFGAVRKHAKPGASYYVTGPQGGDLLLLLLALKDSGFPLRHMLVWAKNNHVLGRSDYHYQHEPILYGWVEGAAHHAVRNRSETSLWQIDKPQKSDLHPTMKPVALYARAMENSSDEGAVVAEPFAGSGTAFIAGEQQGRRVFGCEISPAYCDVIVERWQNLTGGKAKRG